MGFNLLKIKGLMSEKKITQDELAKMMQSTRQTISNYLAGRSKLDVHTLEKIASCLDVNVSYFFMDETDQLSEPTTSYAKKPKYIEQRIDELEQKYKELEKKMLKK